jgi:hypothetical protein
MGAFADGANGLILGEVSDRIIFNNKFLEFNSHIMIIVNPK